MGGDADWARRTGTRTSASLIRIRLVAEVTRQRRRLRMHGQHLMARSDSSRTALRRGIRVGIGLRSTGSSTDRSAAFTGFIATMASSTSRARAIIGFDSASSRCGRPASSGDGQTRDLAGSDAISSARDVLFDPGRGAVPRISALLMMRSAANDRRRRQRQGHFGAQ